MPYLAQKLSRKDLAIGALTFLVVLLSTSLTQIDETPYEATIPAICGMFLTIGFLLEIPINMPLIAVIHLINALFGGDGGTYPIPYESYFAILPWLTALVYAGVVLLFLSGINKARKE